MSLLFPSPPSPRALTWRMVSRRRDLEPTFGGPTSRIRRLGSRWSVDVEMPPMSYADAMAWVAMLASAEADTVQMSIPQPDFDPGAAGAVLVNGAGQLGSSLALDGFTPEYVAKAGQWFNLVGATGQKYLYQVAADTVASGGAAAALPISPMIRRSPADNSAADFVTPVIEGFISGREASWTVDVARTVGLTFSITERE